MGNGTHANGKILLKRDRSHLAPRIDPWTTTTKEMVVGDENDCTRQAAASEEYIVLG